MEWHSGGTGKRLAMPCRPSRNPVTADDTLAQLADLGITFTGGTRGAITDLDAIRGRVAAAADVLRETMRQLVEDDVPRLLAALKAANEEIARLEAAISGKDSFTTITMPRR